MEKNRQIKAFRFCFCIIKGIAKREMNEWKMMALYNPEEEAINIPVIKRISMRIGKRIGDIISNWEGEENETENVSERGREKQNKKN